MKRGRWWPLQAIGACGGAVTLLACGGDANSVHGLPEAGIDSTTVDVAERDTPGEDTSADASTGAMSSDGGPACPLFDASGLDEGEVASGFQSVWQVYRCWFCHQTNPHAVTDAGAGITLSGDNNGLGYNSMRYPPNLTNDPTGLGCWTNQQVDTAIREGHDPTGADLCGMPKFGHALFVEGGPSPGTPMDAGTAQEIIAYLRSLPPVSNHVMESTCPPPASGEAGSDVATDALAEGSD